MAIRPIIETPDPLLRTISTPVEAIDDELQVLIDDMFETMYDAPGIGLAAIQVGVPKRVLVIDLQEPESDEEGAPPVKRPLVFINPQILEGSADMSVYGRAGWTGRAASTRRNWKGCSPPASSMRWIISKAFSSSTISRASSGTCCSRSWRRAARPPKR